VVVVTYLDTYPLTYSPETHTGRPSVVMQACMFIQDTGFLYIFINILFQYFNNIHHPYFFYIHFYILLLLPRPLPASTIYLLLTD